MTAVYHRPFDEGSTGDSLEDFFSSFEVEVINGKKVGTTLLKAPSPPPGNTTTAITESIIPKDRTLLTASSPTRVVGTAINPTAVLVGNKKALTKYQPAPDTIFSVGSSRLSGTIGTHSNPPSSSLFSSSDESCEDAGGIGVEATATYETNGCKILPSKTILTTSSTAAYTRAFAPITPPRTTTNKGHALVDEDDGIPIIAASPSSHWDEYGFPLFPNNNLSYHSPPLLSGSSLLSSTTNQANTNNNNRSTTGAGAGTGTGTGIGQSTTAGRSLVSSSNNHNNQRPLGSSSINIDSNNDQPTLTCTPTVKSIFSTTRTQKSSSKSPDNVTHHSPQGVEEIVRVVSLDIKEEDKKKKKVDKPYAEDLIYQPHPEISCNLSSTSVSTMTKENQSNAQDPYFSSAGHKGRKRPNHNGSSGNIGITKAFSKLALCGQSARETSLNLEYVVLTLKQAITAEEATTSLKHMVKVLKDGRNRSANMSTTELQEGLVAAGADHCVISTLWNFPSNIPVQYYGIVALGELVAHSHLQNQKSIVLKGGIEVVLTAMKTHIEQEAIQEEACRALKNIMKYFDNAKQQVARHKGISRILQAMMTHPEYATVQRQACYALTSLSCLKIISDELVMKQGHAVLLKTMQHHNDDPYVLAESWRTLTNIVIHAMNTVLDEEIAAHGVPLVFEALDKFADCTLVPIQARGMTLLTHLCYRSPANLEFVTQTDHLDIIRRLLQLWRYDEKVQAAGDKLVQQISQAGYPTAAVMMTTVNNHNTSPPISTRSSGTRRSSGRSQSAARRRSRSRSDSRNRNTPPPQNAVISQIRNDRGLDVIVDATMY